MDQPPEVRLQLLPSARQSPQPRRAARMGGDHSFMHDQISTDKNHPDVNGGGPNYAVNAGHGSLVILDQADNSTYSIDIPTRDIPDKVPSRFPAPNPPSFF